jgi:hypothetical protein
MLIRRPFIDEPHNISRKNGNLTFPTHPLCAVFGFRRQGASQHIDAVRPSAISNKGTICFYVRDIDTSGRWYN